MALAINRYVFMAFSLPQMKRKTAPPKGRPTKRAKTIGDYQKGRELAKVPKQELKAFDVALRTNTFATIAGPPTFDTLNAMVNGAELYQRVGRKVYMKSLHIRGQCTPNGVANESACRIIIYYDSQPNAAAPLIGDLIKDSNAAAASTWISEINLVNRQRFKILRDMQFIFGSSTNAAGAAELVPDPIKQSFNVDVFIKLKGLEAIYNATNGGTVADITSGAIGLVCFGDANAGAHDFIYGARLRYYD